MPWPFRSRIPAHASFSVGPYKLDAPVGELRNVVEFSAEEYTAMKRQFRGERSYHTPPVQFLGCQWGLALQTVDGQICKIAPHIEPGSKAEANPIAMRTLQFCVQQLGKPAEQRTGLFIWDTTDGNVILQTADTAEGLAINLFLTSRSVRKFARL